MLDRVAILVIVAVVVGGGVSRASIVLTIDNHSFENDVDLDEGEFTSASPAGWELASGDGVGVFNPTESHISGEATDGNHVAYLNEPNLFIGDFFDGSSTSLVTVSPGLTIVFTLDVGRRFDSAPGVLRVGLQTPHSGSEIITLDEATYDLSTQDPGTWSTQTFSLTISDVLDSGVNEGDELRFFFQNNTSNDSQVLIDNVRAVALPEPSTYLVFAGLITCFGLAGWWRKRRNVA